jgi:hypothetical protein
MQVQSIKTGYHNPTDPGDPRRMGADVNEREERGKGKGATKVN